MERRQVALQESLAFRLARGSGQAAAWHLGRNGNVSPRQLTRRARGLAGIESQALGATLSVHARRDGADQVIARRDGRLAVAPPTAGTQERLEFGCAHVRIASPASAHDLIGVGAHGRGLRVGRHVRPEWRPPLAGETRRASRAATGRRPLRSWEANHG